MAADRTADRLSTKTIFFDTAYIPERYHRISTGAGGCQNISRIKKCRAEYLIIT
jgi:hypothetical protein